MNTQRRGVAQRTAVVRIEKARTRSILSRWRPGRLDGG
jgi:hypothetical protein